MPTLAEIDAEIAKRQAGPSISDIDAEIARRQEPKQQDDGFFGASVIEPALAIGSGALSSALGGATALANMPFSGADEAAEQVKAIENAFTYEPKTKSGKDAMKALGDFIAPLTEKIQDAENYLGEEGAKINPLMGALNKASPTAILEMLGLSGIKKLTKAPGGHRMSVDQALANEGIDPATLKPNVKEFIAKQHKNADPEQVARLARFKQQDVPALQGEIDKNLLQRKTEQQLLESTSEPVADPLRSVKLRQSEAIKNELTDIVDAPGDVGLSIKEGLQDRRGALRAERKQAYDALGDKAKTMSDVKVVTDDILSSLPDKGDLRDIAVTNPTQMSVIDDLLTEFGVIKDSGKIEALTSQGVEITPLDLSNFERFRKRLRNVEKTDQTGTISRVTGPIRQKLDEEIDLAVSSVEKKGGDVGQLAKDARLAHGSLKTEFDEKSITAKLIDNQKKSNMPKIEASKAYQKIMAPTAPIENLERVLWSLRGAGPQGHRAIRDMQGRAILDLLDSAFSAQSRQIGGQRTFGATPFSKQYEKLEQKLRELFRGDKKSMKRIEQVYKTAQDIIPPNAAIPKGSAGFFVDALNTIGVYSIAAKVPFFREAMELLKKTGESATSRKQVIKSLNAKPQVNRTIRMIERDYPQLAVVLGIKSLFGTED